MSVVGVLRMDRDAEDASLGDASLGKEELVGNHHSSTQPGLTSLSF